MTSSLAALLSPRGILDVLQARVSDLTDEEMLWEPVDGCLSLREVDGVWTMDALPGAPHHFDGGLEPVTTIGWRLAHIAGDGLTSERNARWLGVDEPAPPPRAWPGSPPSTADEMREWLAAATEWWCALVQRSDDEHLWQAIGTIGGPFGDAPRAGFVLHINTDVTHHGGEVGVLRDLWRAGLR